jgi:hypothetical protein
MIDPKSLRIGNLVMLPSDTPAVDDGLIKNIATVTGVLGNMVHWEAPCIYAGRCHSGTKPEFLSPIPLDESWLTRAGFVKSESRDQDGPMNFYMKGDFSLDQPTPEPFIYWTDDGKAVYVWYVHSLQNLYFALTGEELSFAEVGDSLSQPPAAGLSLDGNS